MKKPSVLITIDWFLPGTNSGGPVRSYSNLIDHLKDTVDFYVLTRDTDYCETEAYSNVVSNAWNAITSGLEVYYLSSDQINKKAISKVILSKNFDYIFINGVYSWYFSIVPLLVSKKTSNVIISARGMLNDQAFSVKPVKKKIYLTLAKLFRLYTNVSWHATNEIEADQIKTRIGLNSRVKIAPNLARKGQIEYEQIELQKPVRLVNVARIAKEKGTLKMLKALQKVSTPLILDIYGSIYDQYYWKQCLEIISAMPDFIKVNYKGVARSEDIPIVLRGYNFFVMLSEGENFGHSILEALSVGLPVIISSKTPWRNLQKFGVGWDLDLNIETDIIEVLNTVAQYDDANYMKMSRASVEYAQQFINDPELIEANKKLFLS